MSFGKVFGGILILFGLYTWYLELEGPEPGSVEAQSYDGIADIALAIIDALPVAFLPGLLAILIGAALIYKT